MSRLLYILICIDLCFCYNFIDNYSKYVKKHVGNRERSKEQNRGSQVVFDVAEFMKTEKNLDIDPNVAENEEKTGHIQSNYDYSGLINDITGNEDENEYTNVKDSEIDKSLSDLLSMENSNNDKDPEFVKMLTDLVHNPEKKCALKNMKVPFFSHSSSTTKSRKVKKKKFICINCNKNEKNEPSNSYVPNTLEKPKRLSVFKHRKNVFKNFLGRKKAKKKVIHNCRQFYQNKAKLSESSGSLNELTKYTEQFTTEKVKENVEYNDDIMDENDNSETGNRIKRDDSDERERRLKILDELEKKVDNLQIGSPTVAKTPTPTDVAQRFVLT